MADKLSGGNAADDIYGDLSSAWDDPGATIDTGGGLSDLGDKAALDDIKGDVGKEMDTDAGGDEKPSPRSAKASEQPRDETGKFAPKTADEAPVAPPAAPPAAKPDDAAAPPAADPNAAATDFRPPPSWSPAAKAAYVNLPPEVKADIAKREVEVANGFQELTNYRDLKPFTEMAKAKNDTLPGMINKYVEAERALDTNPIGALLWLCRSYNCHPQILLQALNGGPQQQVPRNVAPTPGAQVPQQSAPQGAPPAQQQVPQPQYQSDPRIAQLEQRIAQLQQTIVPAVQQIQQEPLQQKVNQFLNDPKYPYAHNVKEDMALLLKNERAQSLEEAYEMATWSRPDIRPLLIEKQRKDAADQAAERAKAAASNARAASKSVTGSPVPGASSTPDTSHLTLEDQLRMAFGDARV